MGFSGEKRSVAMNLFLLLLLKPLLVGTDGGGVKRCSQAHNFLNIIKSYFGPSIALSHFSVCVFFIPLIGSFFRALY